MFHTPPPQADPLPCLRGGARLPQRLRRGIVKQVKIMNMKKYENPMLQIVSISKNDVIATSINAPLSGTQANEDALAPGMRSFESYYEGY